MGIAVIDSNAGIGAQLFMESQFAPLNIGHGEPLGAAIVLSLLVKTCNTLAATVECGWGSLISISKRLVCSTEVPAALALPEPLMRSPSQSPGNWRSSISGGIR